MKYNKFKKQLKKEFNENYAEEKKSAKLKTNFFAFLIPGLVVLAFAVIITVIVSLEMPKKIETKQLNEKVAYYEDIVNEKISHYENSGYYEMTKCEEQTFYDYYDVQEELYYRRFVENSKSIGGADIAPTEDWETSTPDSREDTSYNTNNQEENSI